MDSGIDTGGELLVQNEVSLRDLDNFWTTCAEVGFTLPIMLLLP